MKGTVEGGDVVKEVSGGGVTHGMPVGAGEDFKNFFVRSGSG